jgi:signal recognition particle subunit SRP54
MCGLQGSGKTTTSAKLGRRLRLREKKRVLLASLDVQRPAPSSSSRCWPGSARSAACPIVAGQRPLDITRRALDTARREGYDVLVLDTAGRLSIDEALMAELVQVRDLARPHETLLVADALTGQDAVNTARIFNERVGVTGIVLTRMDGDARGGAALSMRHVTGKPIKLVGVGEKLDALEAFHPERVASRILDMGDVVSLVEKAAETIDREQAEKLAKRMQKGRFDLEDLRSQLDQVRKMGGMKGIMAKLPGVQKMQRQMAEANVDEKVIQRQCAIIDSMTKKERRDAELIHASRKRRIAAGLRHDRAGDQPAAQAAPPDAGHDEAREEDGRDAEHPAAHGARRRAPARPAPALEGGHTPKSTARTGVESRHGQDSLGARRRQEAPLLPDRGGGLPQPARRPLPREARHLQPAAEGGGP